MLEQLKLEAPDGIDVYFDNVGGETLEAALSALQNRAGGGRVYRTLRWEERGQDGGKDGLSIKAQ